MKPALLTEVPSSPTCCRLIAMNSTSPSSTPAPMQPRLSTTGMAANGPPRQNHSGATSSAPSSMREAV